MAVCTGNQVTPCRTQQHVQTLPAPGTDVLMNNIVDCMHGFLWFFVSFHGFISLRVPGPASSQVSWGPHPSQGMILLGTRVVAQSPRPWLALAKLGLCNRSHLVVCSRWRLDVCPGRRDAAGETRKGGERLEASVFIYSVVGEKHLQQQHPSTCTWEFPWGIICAITRVTGAAPPQPRNPSPRV